MERAICSDRHLLTRGPEIWLFTILGSCVLDPRRPFGDNATNATAVSTRRCIAVEDKVKSLEFISIEALTQTELKHFFFNY